MAAQRLECPVCLEVQDGQQHQCREGHVFCATCDSNLRAPRRCPECRMALGPLSQAIRSRSHEERIAALPAACSHCGLATTRGCSNVLERSRPSPYSTSSSIVAGAVQAEGCVCARKA